GIQLRPRDLQQLYPNADQWQIQYQQHEVANIQRGNQAPDQFRIAGKQEGPGLQAIVLKCRQQNGCSGGCGQAQRKQRHQNACGRGVVGGLWPCDTLDSAFTELALV